MQKISLKMVNPRDIGGKAEEEDFVSRNWQCYSPADKTGLLLLRLERIDSKTKLQSQIYQDLLFQSHSFS